jgi:hypothetical protein
MKFGVEVSYRSLSSKGEFCENWRSDSHTLRVGVNEFTLVISTFCDRMEWNSVQRICTYYCLTVIRFVKIGVLKAVLLQGINDNFPILYILRPISIKFGKGNVRGDLFAIVSFGTLTDHSPPLPCCNINNSFCWLRLKLLCMVGI